MSKMIINWTGKDGNSFLTHLKNVKWNFLPINHLRLKRNRANQKTIKKRNCAVFCGKSTIFVSMEFRTTFHFLPLTTLATSTTTMTSTTMCRHIPAKLILQPATNFCQIFMKMSILFLLKINYY